MRLDVLGAWLAIRAELGAQLQALYRQLHDPLEVFVCFEQRAALELFCHSKRHRCIAVGSILARQLKEGFTVTLARGLVFGPGDPRGGPSP